MSNNSQTYIRSTWALKIDHSFIQGSMLLKPKMTLVFASQTSLSKSLPLCLEKSPRLKRHCHPWLEHPRLLSLPSLWQASPLEQLAGYFSKSFSAQNTAKLKPQSGSKSVLNPYWIHRKTKFSFNLVQFLSISDNDNDNNNDYNYDNINDNIDNS